MALLGVLPETVALASDGRGWYVAVPTGYAERLQIELRRRGFLSTFYQESYAPEARLELWPDADHKAVQAALDELRQLPPS